MASRMDRYYRNQKNTYRRSERNRSLYQEIYDNSSYSNIEGIATIEKTNEVDITKIKNMLKNREEYQKQRGFRQAIKKTEPPKNIEQIATLDEEKNYDIRDILDKAKVNKKIDNSYHSINNTNYNILKNIKTFDSYEEEEESERLKDLINTITNTSLLNQMGDKDLSLDLLDDLKSDDDDTIIESKDSVKALLEQAKMEAKKEVKNNVPVELDKSFFTSSLNFGEDDFEQISNLNKKLKKNTVLIRILILLIIIAVTIGIIFLVYSLIK